VLSDRRGDGLTVGVEIRPAQARNATSLPKEIETFVG
jgi:hypothetical protein